MTEFAASLMFFFHNHFATVVLVLLALGVHGFWWRLYSGRRLARIVLPVLTGLVLLALALESQRINRLLPPLLFTTLHALGLGWSLACMAVFIAQTVDRAITQTVKRLMRRRLPSSGPPSDAIESPERRRVLTTLRAAIYAAPAVALGYGTFIERQQFRLQEVDLVIPNLPKELDGLRIVQITDIHMGAFLWRRDMDRIVGMANETKAHLAIMTGDLVTRLGDPVETCLRQLAEVKADAGMIGCLGNHEIYAGAEDYVEKQGARLGIEFLRSERKLMQFRGQKLNFAGVDYQKKGLPYLRGAEKLIEPGVTNILLSHNPDVFPVAAAQGYDLTLSGHTHGGQITVEYLQQFVNPARFVTRYVSGHYQEGSKQVYVSRGLGTVGVPTRIAAPPELTLIRLRSDAPMVT